MPDTSAFDRTIAPLTREAFLTEYWGRSFVRLTGARSRFQSVLSWDDLNGLLEYHALGPRQIELVQNGKPVDRKRFLSQQGATTRLKASGIVAALSEGATLVVDRVDELAPGARAVAEAFEEVLRTTTTINLYAGWRTQKGFDLHWDPQDTLILQVSGRKHWQVYRPTRLHPLDADVEQAAKPTGDPVWDGILEDGDAIYMPRGWWHVAVPLDEPSLHLTVTMVPADGVNLLSWLAGELKRHEDVRMNVPALADASTRQQYTSRLRALVAGALTDETLDRFLADWESRIRLRPHVRLPLAPIDQRAPLTMDTHVRLAANRRLAFEQTPDTGVVSFHANDVRWECAAGIVPALEHLHGDASVSIRELSGHLADQALAPKLLTLLTALAMVGAVWVEPHADRASPTRT